MKIDTQHLRNTSTQHLLKALVAFIELQIIAIKLRDKMFQFHFNRIGVYKFLPDPWYLTAGICINLYKTHSQLEKETWSTLLLTRLFRHCPDFSGLDRFPVKTAGNVGYGSCIADHFWGNHAYADNRRKIIQQCIDQLRAELISRKVKV